MEDSPPSLQGNPLDDDAKTECEAPAPDNPLDDDAVSVTTLSSGEEEELNTVSDATPDDYFISSDEDTIITPPTPIDGRPLTPDIRSYRLRTPEIHPDDIYGEQDAQVWNFQEEKPEFTSEELARLDLFTGAAPVFEN